MTRVAVLGAGGGGLSAAVELTRAGYDVVLWNRRAATMAAYREAGEIAHEGVLGTGRTPVAAMTTDLAVAAAAADVLVVCLPSLAHGALFDDLAELGVRLPVVMNPGHTGAALHARQVWASRGAELPPLAELSTLTYVARVAEDGTVRTTGRARVVRAGCLPGGEEAVGWARRLFPAADPVPDVLASSLSNVNLVLHPPGAVLGLAWVEATGGAFTFYGDAMTDGVAAVMGALDLERRAVASAYGHTLPSLVDEMAAIGTVDAVPPEGPGALAAAIKGGAANSSILAPSSTLHRYYREDLPFGLGPLVALAGVAGSDVPVARSLLQLGSVVLGEETMRVGLNQDRLGVRGWGRDELLASVRHP
jgi:opine dehydrogenase